MVEASEMLEVRLDTAIAVYFEWVQYGLAWLKMDWF